MEGVSLIDIFEGAVAKSGQSTCVCLEDGRTYSYQQVDEIATCIGKELACAVESAAINEDDSETPLVAVMMTRGIGLVSAILGILKAGAAYVPVDPAFPPDRQTHIFAHSKCKMLITDEESLELALSLGVIVPPTLVINSVIPQVDRDITVSTIVKRTLHLPAFNNLNKVAILSIARDKVSNREDGGLAYVLYTSGSTGKPKGVMLKQAGVVNIVNWFADELNLDSNSRVLGLTTFCFDIRYRKCCHLSTIIRTLFLKCTVSLTQTIDMPLLMITAYYVLNCITMNPNPNTYFTVLTVFSRCFYLYFAEHLWSW